MELGFISEMYMPIVMVICLVAGYIMKHWIKDIDNKIIPSVLALLGALTACLSVKDISMDLITAGMVTGLASTGLHQAFKQMLEGGHKNE